MESSAQPKRISKGQPRSPVPAGPEGLQKTNNFCDFTIRVLIAFDQTRRMLMRDLFAVAR